MIVDLSIDALKRNSIIKNKVHLLKCGNCNKENFYKTSELAKANYYVLTDGKFEVVVCYDCLNLDLLKYKNVFNLYTKVKNKMLQK
jgi:hypothetical protein